MPARMTALLCVIVLLYYSGDVNVHGSILDDVSEKELVDMIKNVMECRQIPGLVMTLVKGKEMKTFPMGVTEVSSGQIMRSKTLFPLGSITQSFTSTLIAILTQRSAGVIHFDTPVEKLIGGEMKLSTDIHTKEITLRDLLMHRTGLSAASLSVLSGLPDGLTRGNLVRKLKELPQVSGLRSDFQFNSLMYTLAGHVAEKLTGNSWEGLMKTLVMDKIGMTSSKVKVDSMSGPEFPHAYVSVDDELVEADSSIYDMGPLAPAGHLYSNGQDMGKAMRFFLGDPSLVSRVELPTIIMEELMNPRALLSPGYRASLDRSGHQWPVPDVSVGFAMGFFRNVYRGYQVPWQSGSLPGFQSMMWLIPEKGLGVFIAINGQKHSELPLATLQALAYYASDLLLEADPWLNKTSACTFPEPFVKPVSFPDFSFDVKNPDFQLSDYQGSYTNGLLGDMTIGTSETNAKALIFNLGKAVGELLPEGGNVFRLFLEGAFKFMTSPTKSKARIPYVRLFFEFKGPECIGVKVPDSIFGGTPIHFDKKPPVKEEL